MKAMLVLLLHHLAVAASLHLRIGSRPSPLACTQAEAIATALKKADPTISIDIVKITSRSEAGAEPVAAGATMAGTDFTGNIDDAVLSGAVDIGVHSLKDLPPLHRWEAANALAIGCHLPREDPWDVLIGASSLAASSLPFNARVGSASVRRRAQLLALRPDVQVVGLRGNVQARLDALEGNQVGRAAALTARSRPAVTISLHSHPLHSPA